MGSSFFRITVLLLKSDFERTSHFLKDHFFLNLMRMG